MLVCSWCGETYGNDEAVDRTTDGWWCDICDSFCYVDPNSTRARFLVVTETPQRASKRPPETVISLRKRVSPLRYPGGKSKTIDTLYSLLNKEKLSCFTEVFAGGASLGLSLLDAGCIEKLVLNDLDPAVSSFWKVCTRFPTELTSRLECITPSREMFFRSRNKVLEGNGTEVELAWAQLVVNRCAFSGIAMANPMSEITARWNPNDLIRRIRRISEMADSIQVTSLPYEQVIEEQYWQDRGTLFVDPPYVTKGSKLYPYYFKESDHRSLAWLLQELYRGFPSADILVTYDDHPLIKEIYPLAKIKPLNRIFSIAN